MANSTNTSPPTKLPTRDVMLRLTRQAFGKTTLQSMSDEQAIAFYKELWGLLRSTNAPYARIRDWLHTLQLPQIEARSEETLKLNVKLIGRRLFGKIKDTWKTIPEAHKQLREQKEQAVERVETEERGKIKEELQAKFDPLRETIAATVRFREEFEFWAKKSRYREIADPQLAKLGTLYRESIRDSIETFKTLDLIDEDVMERARQQVNINSINVLVNQGDQEKTNNLLDSFLSKISELPNMIEGGNCEAGPDTTDGESGTGETITVEYREGTESLSERDEIDRGIPGEPPEGDDWPD